MVGVWLVVVGVPVGDPWGRRLSLASMWMLVLRMFLVGSVHAVPGARVGGPLAMRALRQALGVHFPWLFVGSVCLQLLGPPWGSTCRCCASSLRL